MSGAGWRLVSDVGGTNVRFARASVEGEIDARRSYAVADFPAFTDALAAYLEETGRPEFASFAIGAAGPVDRGRVRLTNAPWTLDIDEIAAALAGARGALVNDLEAAAMALPFLDKSDFRHVGPHIETPSQSRMLALNIGTGFGASVVIPTPTGWATCPSEAGHMALAIAEREELALLEAGRSVEDILSGPGVVALYRFLGGGREGETLTSAEILARAPSDPIASEVCRHVTRLLGRVAGDLVLATAAWGGAYLFGSVVRGWEKAASAQSFRSAFENKGAMRKRMEAVPSAIVTYEDAAFFGLAKLPLPA